MHTTVTAGAKDLSAFAHFLEDHFGSLRRAFEVMVKASRLSPGTLSLSLRQWEQVLDQHLHFTSVEGARRLFFALDGAGFGRVILTDLEAYGRTELAHTPMALTDLR